MTNEEQKLLKKLLEDKEKLIEIKKKHGKEYQYLTKDVKMESSNKKK